MDGFAIAGVVICILLACCGGCYLALDRLFFTDVADGRSAPAASYGAADSTHGS